MENVTAVPSGAICPAPFRTVAVSVDAKSFFAGFGLAVTVMLPLLTIMTDFLGVVGGLFIAVVEVKIGASFYLTTVLQTLKSNDILHGLCKTPFFGFAIAMIGCYNGLNASGGADGVGRATTIAVVVSSISVLAADFFLTKIFLSLPWGLN